MFSFIYHLYHRVQFVLPPRFIYLFVLTFFIDAGHLNAQTSSRDTTIGYHYKMIVETPIFLCNIRGTQVSDSLYEAPSNAIFTHIGNKGDSVIIRFWVWKKDQTEAVYAYNYKDSKRRERLYFLMSKSDFQNKTIRRYSRRPSFAIGTAAVPFKIRTSPFNFTNDIGIGPVVGIKFRLSRYNNKNFFNVLLGFGLSSVNLDSLSTNGNVTTNSPITNPAALTLSAGGVFEFSNIQVGAFIGRDYINRNNKIDWIYQGKTWLSIGLGYTLFSKSTTNQKGNTRNNTTTIGG